MLTRRPKGTNDLLPPQTVKWQFVEDKARRLCALYGYEEIRTPVFEHTELFVRGVGEATDIVEKEMYTFNDRGGRSITLRPEGTAPAVRAFLEAGLHAASLPAKFYYIGPMFRYDQPQAGRFRQFHQFGVEVFGSNDPAVDAEVVAMATAYFETLGLKNFAVHLGSVGCPQCRPFYREKLRAFLAERLDNLCPVCRDRYDRNPLRILDCKLEQCRQVVSTAPVMLDFLCPDCNEHFAAVRRYLDRLHVTYIIDRYLVRGLDYYTQTAFEIIVPEIGAQSSIGGGGRYNGLIAALGGPQLPGIGFAVGLERVILAMEKEGIIFPSSRREQKVFVAFTGSSLKETALEVVFKLRQAGVAAEMDYSERSLKGQLKYAGRAGFPLVVIMGEDELQRGEVLLKDMIAGSQRPVALDNLVEDIKQIWLETKEVRHN